MTKLTFRLSMVVVALGLFMGCKKELSTENGGFGGTAQGELVDSLGYCKAAVINGTYQVDTPLVTTKNYVNISVNFTAVGKYKIYTDTVNGMWFLDSGFAVSTGVTAIKLKGYGTPILPKTTDFSLFFTNTICGFSVTATGSGSTGGGGGGGTGTGTNGDYFPTTSGSKWVYQYVPKLGSIDTFTVIAADQQVQVNGDPIIYSQFGTRLKDTFYFGKDGTGNYYALSTVDFDYTFLFDSIPNNFISYPFLKENAVPLVDTWETADYGQVKYTSGGTTQYGYAKAVFKIIDKNTVPHSAGGKTYQNVINVQRSIMFRLSPAGSPYNLVLQGNSYYAKGYGLIDQVFNTTPSQIVPLFSTPIIQ